MKPGGLPRALVVLGPICELRLRDFADLLALRSSEGFRV